MRVEVDLDGRGFSCPFQGDHWGWSYCMLDNKDCWDNNVKPKPECPLRHGAVEVVAKEKP